MKPIIQHLFRSCCLQIINLKQRGMEFMCVPDTYYEQLRENLKHSKVQITEDLDVLQVRTVPFPEAVLPL